MTYFNKNSMTRVAAIFAAGISLSACNMFDRLSNVGQTPPLSRIENPTQNPGYRPVSMPMPDSIIVNHKSNSLWREGSRAFFKDQRASEVGDILTVIINIDDEAELSNSTSRTRTNSENLGATNMFGLENQFNQWFSGTVTPGSLVDLDSSTNAVGTGSVDREEEINLRVAAIVTQTLPNGNMVLYGRQELRVNFEVRELVVGGVIRPTDITASNTITYDQMAEARIAYGGRGQLMDVQQPRWGSQVYDVIMPF